MQPQHSLMETIRVAGQLEKWSIFFSKFIYGSSSSKFGQPHEKGLLPTPEDGKLMVDTRSKERGGRSGNWDPKFSNIKCYKCNEWGHK